MLSTGQCAMLRRKTSTQKQKQQNVWLNEWMGRVGFIFFYSSVQWCAVSARGIDKRNFCHAGTLERGKKQNSNFVKITFLGIFLELSVLSEARCLNWISRQKKTRVFLTPPKTHRYSLFQKCIEWRMKKKKKKGEKKLCLWNSSTSTIKFCPWIFRQPIITSYHTMN